MWICSLHDTSAFTVSDSAQNLQLSLQTVANDLSSWFKSWALTINVEKTAVMVLCTRQKVPTISIITNGSGIKQVRVQKHLGRWTADLDGSCFYNCQQDFLKTRLATPVATPCTTSGYPNSLPHLCSSCSGERIDPLPGVVLEQPMLSALNDYKRTAARLITGTRLAENVPQEILLARAGLKLADCRKIVKCGIFAFKLAFGKNSNCLPRHVLEAAETWLSLAPDRISDMNSRSQSRTAAIRLPPPRTNTMKSSPFYFKFVSLF